MGFFLKYMNPYSYPYRYPVLFKYGYCTDPIPNLNRSHSPMLLSLASYCHNTLFYDFVQQPFQEKSVYNAPAAISPNLWRDCWVVRAPGVDGCSGRYVVAASAGNSMDSGFCSWDFYTKELPAERLIPKYGTTAHSVFSRGDSIYLGCSSSSSSARKPPSTAQIQQFSLRKQKLFTTYILPESNSHPHYKAITQVWGSSDVAMGVCGSGLFVFDALKDDGSKPLTSDNASGERVRETIGPDNLYCPTFD
ncbi:hypothetical protein HanOQP8_Chr00c008g0684661 [Helianthus annuus]|nr:hypothetical protein HanOQP8_Chr00c008g0684661 [Helianthus annuus]